MVRVPILAVPVLAAALKTTVPLPVPDAPLVIVSHGASAPAVHAHDAPDAVTVIEPAPPGSARLCVVGAIEKVHGGGGGAWDTVKV
jgi:hypothetical protein